MRCKRRRCAAPSTVLLLRAVLAAMRSACPTRLVCLIGRPPNRFSPLLWHEYKAAHPGCEGVARDPGGRLRRERVAALEGVGAAAEMARKEEQMPGRALEAGPEPAVRSSQKSREDPPEMARAPKQKSAEMDFGL